MDRTQIMPGLVDTLRTLATTPSPTGMTEGIEALLVQHLKDLGFSPWQSKKGAVFAKLNEAQGEGILLSAHIDTLGLMVRAVKGNGACASRSWADTLAVRRAGERAGPHPRG